ncbi:ABC transporter ATP-binding protein [Calidifontibacter sp. DB0510]|uniref:ABC transporter ATP-binding protein n=1 Tax=Metallococcus carri TaxID=1656884 RepID=A0A967EBA1_9MICO|nr:ABC transporter ATP-binding protein [Metallococcus carri]NHN57090.1 ABC transporter ATP-binding protein [Metallococcus carri]NOP39041.1 ABC transporter ATP-binding protein [Calidifontibacter sp. DB2511S]
MTTPLPVADRRQVRAAARRLVGQDRRAFVALILLNAAAAAAGLAAPWFIGRIIDAVRAHDGAGTVDRLAVAVLAFSIAQILLSRWANHVGYRFGERTLARVREQLVDRALALPASRVERAGIGDLTARGTTDVAAVGVSLRDTGPEVLISAVQSVLILIAVLVLSPVLGLVGLVGLVGIWWAGRWYLARAREAYLAEGEANSQLAEELSATASGARTVDALRLEQRRLTAAASSIDRAVATRTRTLRLRTVLFPIIDVSYVVPVVAVLLVGSLLLRGGHVTLGVVVAATLYLRQLSQPLDVVLMRLEELQSALASFARVEGLAAAEGDQRAAYGEPADAELAVDGVSYAYRPDFPDVLHEVSLRIRPGERLAVVGPSGAGKTTLGRLLAGVERPRTGSVTVGGVPVADLPPERLRREVVMVTQDSFVFSDSLRDNVILASPTASDEEVWRALAAVDADAWARDLPGELDAQLGAGGIRLDPAQAQQLALARVVLADPHTVVLDEATAMLDPTSARDTERSLAAVLRGRTVIAIAHRLHTAHDADRVAVMEDGRLTEVGSHDELVARAGSYAALWHSWHGDTPPR